MPLLLLHHDDANHLTSLAPVPPPPEGAQPKPKIPSAPGQAQAQQLASMAAAPCRELTGLRRGPAAAVPGRRGANELCLAPFHQRRRRRGLKVVAAISEDLPRLAAPGTGTGTGKGAPEGRRPEKVLVRAALTVRRKHKEDLKEALAGHLDALWDMVGRSVALELISTKIHPSKHSHRRPLPPPPRPPPIHHRAPAVLLLPFCFLAT